MKAEDGLVPSVRAREAAIDKMVDRVARSDSASLLVDDEQGPWPGTKAWDDEVRHNAREIIMVALGL